MFCHIQLQDTLRVSEILEDNLLSLNQTGVLSQKEL